MAKSTSGNPWIAKTHFDALHTRCAEAETCLRDLLDLMNPDWREEHQGDWKRATRSLVKENAQ